MQLESLTNKELAIHCNQMVTDPLVLLLAKRLEECQEELTGYEERQIYYDRS